MSDIDWGFILWPDCPVPGCPHKACRALRSPYCWPHTKGPKFDDLIDSLTDESVEPAREAK